MKEELTGRSDRTPSLTVPAASSAGRSPGTPSLWAGRTCSASQGVSPQCSEERRRICSHTHTHTLAHGANPQHLVWSIRCTSRHRPEVDVQYRCVCEIGHTLNVEDLLELSPAFYGGIDRLGVDIQLWRRWSRRHTARRTTDCSWCYCQ